jgi:tRNA 2-thiouridine synthesizing protein A
METQAHRKLVDSRGSFCPGPLTDLFKAYRAASQGDVIEIWATDPAAKSDLQAWTAHTGNELVSMSEEKDHISIVIRVTNKKA